VPFGRPSSTLVAPENQRLLSPLAPTGLVVHLLRCKHKRGCKRVPPGEDDRPRQSRGGGDVSAGRVPEEDRVHRVAQVPGGFLALPSTGPSREGFDHFLDLCFVPLQKAAHEPLRLGPRQSGHLPKAGVRVDPRSPRGVVQKGQRDHDVAVVLALLQDRRRGQSSSRRRQVASLPEPIDEDRRRM